MPIRSTIGGWVPSSRVSQRGGSGSARFWRVIRRSNDDERVGVVGQLERERVGAALDRARELARDDADRADDDAAGQRQRRQAGRRATLEALARAARPRACRPGATIATKTSRRGTSR